MAEIRIDVTGIDKISELLTRFPDSLQEAVTYAGQEAATEITVTEGIRKYPPVQLPRPAMPMTDRQRRWFFGALNRGEINVPYERAGTASSRFGGQMYVEQSGYVTTIGNSAPYAHYLIGQDQAQYMANLGWRKLADVATEKSGKITQIYTDWINRAVDKAGLG